MVQRRALRHLEQSGLSDMLTRYTFERWRAEERWQARALEEAKRYAADPKGWFVTTGRSGAGKTHLCTAICGELLQQGLPVRYMLWRDVAVRAKAVVNDAEAYSQIVDPLKRVKVLYVDDLFKMGRGSNGAARPTVGDINLVFEIINARYNDSGKITLVSSELSLNDITDIDEATGGRIYEGAKAGAYLDLSNRQNWRLR
jgi:DNA replication protein DnaC